MQRKSLKRPFTVTVEFANGLSRDVRVKASSLEKAEQRALKFHPTAIGVKK